MIGTEVGEDKVHHSCSHSGSFRTWGVNTVGLPRWRGPTSTVGRQRGALPGVSPRTREAVRGGKAWGECEGEDGGVCVREQREGAYPFNPVKAMPRTKFFWNIRKTISGGIETRTEPAMTAW